MGYLVHAHLTRDPPSPEALTRAVQSLPRRGSLWRLYRDDAADAYLIDVVLNERANTFPFTEEPWYFGTNARGAVAALRPEIEAAIAPLYAALEAAGALNSAPRGLIALNVALSLALGTEVLSLAADDDGLDMVCRSTAGALASVELEPGDLLFTWTPQGVRVEPRWPSGALEDQDDPDAEEWWREEITDESALRGLPGVTVLPRSGDVDALLHGLARKRALAFLGGRETFLALGSGDALDIPPPIAQSAPSPGAPGGGWLSTLFGGKR
jgi:hypothetical protein